MTTTPALTRHIVDVARAEALFTSPLPTGCRLTRRQVDAAVAAQVRKRGGVRQCAAEMAAAYGEQPEIAAARMRWALGAVASAYAGPPSPDVVVPMPASATPFVSARGLAA
jgi:hypothetical protein